MNRSDVPDDDVEGPAWVLMGMVVSEEAQKIARLTITCKAESEHGWALDTWRSIRRTTPELEALAGTTVFVPNR